ncbi:MAG: CU044_2847 family protein [Reinekea sp.]|nr:CU044_2847 family protein [Reinekea sp.]
MTTKLVKLDDGTLIEVESLPNEVQQISSKMAHKVNDTLDKVKPILIQTCKPVIAAWQELSQDMDIEQAEIELGLSFEGEGNIYVTKVKSGANLIVKLTLKSTEIAP